MKDFRQIPGFPLYLAGIDGHIYRVIRDKRSPRFPLKRIGHASPYGYINVVLHGPDGNRQVLAHILIAEIFLGPKPTPRHEICHRNGVRIDNRPANLLWGTRAENEAHKVAHNTAPRGERNGRAILDRATVEAMRAMRGAGITYRVLAAKFRVSETNARLICNGATWR